MNARILFLLLATCAIGQAQLSQQSSRADDFDSRPIIQLEALTQAQIERFFAHEDQAIIVCPAGTVLPLTVSMEGDLLSSPPITTSVTLHQKCALTFSNQELLLSGDLQNWSSPFEFTEGKVQAGFSIDENGPRVDLKLETHKRP